jgi:regulatory protein
VTAAGLEAAALKYLGRYASSAAQLRRILMGRVARSARAHGTDSREGAGVVDALVARLQASGLVDDAAYAEATARRLHALGHPPRAISARLAAKGGPREVIEATLARLAGEGADPELAAACRYVRRRGLGPYRPPIERARRREKDLAAMSRAGFGLAVSRRVLAARDADAIEDMLRESA